MVQSISFKIDRCHLEYSALLIVLITNFTGNLEKNRMSHFAEIAMEKTDNIFKNSMNKTLKRIPLSHLIIVLINVSH